MPIGFAGFEDPGFLANLFVVLAIAHDGTIGVSARDQVVMM